MPRHVVARWSALAVAVGATALACGVWITGGGEVSVAGLRLRAHDPGRAMAAALFGWASYLALGGRVGWPVTWSAARVVRVHHLLAALTAAATVGVGAFWGTTAIGGADSYGYVSQAEGWLAGAPRLEQPWVEPAPWPNNTWTFTPLGYAPSPRPGEPWISSPIYAPGLPWMMAAARLVAGQEGLFWIVPLCGGLLVLATYGLGVQLASPPAGLAAAALVATSPILLYMIVAPMSDVPAAAAWAAAFWAMGRPGRPRAILAGVAAALAMTIRPNLAFGAGIVAAGYGLRWWFASAADRGGHRRDVVAYAASLLPGVVAVALVHTVFYGSPLRSGYGTAEDLFFVDAFWPTLGTYVRWLIETQTPLLLVGAAALALPVKRLWPAATDRTAVRLPGAFTLAIWIMYGAYYQFDAWWYLRFLLPAWPFMTVGLAALLVVAASRWRATRVGALLLVVGLGAFGVREAMARGVFGLWQHERRYPSVARLVRERTDTRSVLIGIQHSGSLRYYAGRLTLRADILEPDWLDRAVTWFTARGIRPYFVLDEGEVPFVRDRFAGQRVLSRLDEPPVLVYRGTTAVWLVDLAPEGGRDPAGPTEVRESYGDLRSVPPVPFVPPVF